MKSYNYMKTGEWIMEGNVYSIFRDLAIIIVAAKLCGIIAEIGRAHV